MRDLSTLDRARKRRRRRRFPELLTGGQAAEFIGVAKTSFYAMDSLERIPAAIELRKGFRRWSKTDLRQWVALRAPWREDFDRMMHARLQAEGVIR